VARRSLLRAILASYVGEKPEALQFAYGALGKPQLAWPVASDPVQFNLSDCEALAVVAVARGIGVGVDVERVRGLPDMEAIAERFFSASEQAAFRRVAAPDRPGAFFRCWTRKECYLKAGGGGLTAPLDRFDVSLERYDVPLLLCVEGDPGRAASWTLHHLEPAEGFVGAVACQATGVKIGCWRWPWS
jgi:4'-phosphopantetheinyl transferase